MDDQREMLAERKPLMGPQLPCNASITAARLCRQRGWSRSAGRSPQTQHSTVDVLEHVSDVVIGQRLQCMNRGAWLAGDRVNTL